MNVKINDKQANRTSEDKTSDPTFDENKFLTNCLTVASDEIFRWRKFFAVQYLNGCILCLEVACLGPSARNLTLLWVVSFHWGWRNSVSYWHAGVTDSTESHILLFQTFQQRCFSLCHWSITVTTKGRGHTLLTKNGSIRLKRNVLLEVCVEYVASSMCVQLCDFGESRRLGEASMVNVRESVSRYGACSQHGRQIHASSWT